MSGRSAVFRRLRGPRTPVLPRLATFAVLLPLAAGCVSLRPWSDATHGLAADRLVEVDGRKVSVERAGSGAPLVLLHGFGASTYSFDEVLAPLARKFSVVAIDLNGFGYTERPRDPESYTLPGQARLVLGVLDALKLDRVTLAGHSYGGALALFLASRHPERVDRLLLIDNAMPAYAWENRNGIFRWRWLAALVTRTTGLGDRRIRSGLLESYFDDSKVTPALFDAYASRLRIEGAIDAYRGLLGPTDVPRADVDLATISQPTLAVWGAEDELIPAAAARERVGALPHGRFVEIPRCGHTPMEDCPEAFLQAVEPFLAGE